MARLGLKSIRSVKRAQATPKVSFFLLLEMENLEMELNYAGDRKEGYAKLALQNLPFSLCTLYISSVP